MAQEIINVGDANQKQGDTPFVFCPKINRNFTELYSKLPLDQQQMFYVAKAGNDISLASLTGQVFFSADPPQIAQDKPHNRSSDTL